MGKLEGGSFILFNGAPPTPALLRHCVGYVEQNSALLPLLTPRETLLYTILLKAPPAQPKGEKERHVDALLKRCGRQGWGTELVGCCLLLGTGAFDQRTNHGFNLHC